MKTTIIKKLIFSSVAFLFLLLPVSGQNLVTRTGIVTDKVTKELLPGVQVVVKGTSKGTVTDFNGTYEIETERNQLLTFTMLGYDIEEVRVEDGRVLNIQLTPASYDLDEVVVTALGIVRETRSLGY